MDPIDQAQLEIESAVELALRRRRPELEALPTGHCLNCDEPLESGRRWCDAACRDEWAALQARAAGG